MSRIMEEDESFVAVQQPVPKFNYYGLEDFILEYKCEGYFVSQIEKIFSNELPRPAPSNFSVLLEKSRSYKLCGSFGALIVLPDNFAVKKRVPKLSSVLELELFKKDSKNESLLLPQAIYCDSGKVCFFYKLNEVLSNLESINKQNPITFGQSSFVVFYVLKALIYLHENNIIHRDLHPGNIFIKNNQIKIGNFEYAVKASCSQFSIDINTHYPYASPDQIMPKTAFTTKSDIWSVGIVYCELITRLKEAPFHLLQPEDKKATPLIMSRLNVEQFVINHNGHLLLNCGNGTARVLDKVAFQFVRDCLQKQAQLRPSASELLFHPCLTHKHQLFTL
jgi:serine/threonine protein kinase